MSDHIPLPAGAKTLRRGKTLPIVGAVLTAGVIATFATVTYGQGYGYGPGPGYGPGNGPGYGRMMGPGDGSNNYGPGYGRGWGGGGPGYWRSGPANIDPVTAEAWADKRARYLAVAIGANAEQQEKLATIAKGVVKDMLPMRDKRLAARTQGRELLTAKTVDRAALEKLRAEQIATQDAASKRTIQALVDAAEVLTPEQRAKIDTLLPVLGGGGRGAGMMNGWSMGGGRGMGGWR
jgi:Spy/CpxP family protein refolding chaperone